MSLKEDRRVQIAYLAVLGEEGKRTDDQKVVWRDIESFCRAYRLSCEAVAGGEYAENNMLVNEGRRSVWLRMRGMVLLALLPPPELPKISRQKRKLNP